MLNLENYITEFSHNFNFHKYTLKFSHTYRNRTTIFKPFNFQIRVRHWFQFALEVGMFSFAEILLTFRSCDESRFNGDNLVDHLLPLVSGSILQVLYSLQTLRMLGLQEQIFLRVYPHWTGCDGFPQLVPRLTGIYAWIFRVDAQDVKGDVVEFVGRSESVACLHRSPIHEPFHSHCRVADRLETTLEMHVGELHCFDIVQGAGKLGRLHHRHFFLLGLAVSVHCWKCEFRYSAVFFLNLKSRDWFQLRLNCIFHYFFDIIIEKVYLLFV